jgi:hypothetical protein
MLIMAKIGTHPQKQVKVMYKRTLPTKGDHIKVKDHKEPYAKQIGCYVEEIKDLGNYNLYFLSKM